MEKFFAKLVFRLRDTVNNGLMARLRRAYWCTLGMRVGRGTSLPQLHVTWPHQVAFGSQCVLEHGSYFKFDGIYQPGPKLVFGDEVFIGVGCEFNIRSGLSVGDNCLIASGCYFVDHDHGFSTRAVPMGSQADGAEAPIVIEDDVWIGANVVVLKGVTVGRGAIVAAGAVLTRPVAQFEIWGGVPARKIRDRPLDSI